MRDLRRIHKLKAQAEEHTRKAYVAREKYVGLMRVLQAELIDALKLNPSIVAINAETGNVYPIKTPPSLECDECYEDYEDDDGDSFHEILKEHPDLYWMLIDKPPR